MPHEDPWPDPVDAKRHEAEKAEGHPDPIPGFGLGTGRLGDHGLGADRLKHAGLGGEHQPAHKHSEGAPSMPGVHHRGDEGWHPPERAQIVSPLPQVGHKPPEPPKLPPPLYSGKIDEPVKITRRQVFAAIASLGVLGVLIVLALRMNPGGGGQFEELGQKLGEGPARAYKYVADRSRQLYWPNEIKYSNAIPQADRLYIRDDQDLAGYSNYQPGQL
jgi:hypothetical protein